MAGEGQSAATMAGGTAAAQQIAIFRAPGLLSRLSATVVGEIEAEQDRWFLWVAVGFGAGAAGYFNLTLEPPLWTLALLAAGTCLVHQFARRVGLWGLANTWLSGARYGWDQGMYLWFCNAALLATAVKPETRLRVRAPSAS